MRNPTGVLLMIIAMLLAGCAATEKPAATAAAKPQRYMEFRRASYEEVPGYLLTRPPKEETRVFVAPEVLLNERDIVSTTIVKIEDKFGVGVEFNRAGARALRTFTENGRGLYLAFIMDGEVRMVLPILTPVRDGRMLLSSGFDKPQADELVREIRLRIP